MNLLLKQVKIIYPGHPYHRKQLDILIKDGLIKKIGKSVRSQKSDIISIKNAHLSLGWLDINTFNGEPGLEHRETFESLAKSAWAGGYTSLAPAPNTYPVADNKTSIHFQIKQRKLLGVNIFPLGSITVDNAGKDIAELIDMHHAGAIAFTDGFSPVQNNGVMMRALQYVKSFNGLVLNHPHDRTLAEEGLIHEGEVSTSLGMKGIPSLSEELMLQRDLDLLAYTDSRLHILNISCKESVELIRQAKRSKLNVSTSVPIMNLIGTDQNCLEFDYGYKVLPPLRSKDDKIRLYEGIKDGTIDGLNSNHVPVDEEHKKLEFAHSEFGAIGLETAFALLNTHYPKDLDLWIDCLAIRNRTVLGIPLPKLEIGAKAELTLFDPKKSWNFDRSTVQSLSKNSPFLGAKFTGKVLGVVNGEVYHVDRV